MVGAEERGTLLSLDRDRRIYRLALAISRRSCVVKAKKCTKKCDARAELLFCSFNLLFFDVPVTVVVVVS